MNPKLKILYFLIDFILPLTAGYLLVHRTRLTGRFFDRMIYVAILGLGTPLALVSAWNIHPDPNLLWLPVLGVLMQVVPGAVGFYMLRGRFPDPLERGSSVLSCMLSNRGVMGSVTVVMLFGEDGYAMARLVMLLAPIVVYCFCFPMANYFHSLSTEEETVRPSLRAILLDSRQIPMVGLLVGLGLAIGGVPRPEPLGRVFDWAFHPSMWAFTIPVGASLHLAHMRRYLGEAMRVVPLKLLLTPLVVTALALLVGLDGTALWTVAILSASPTALNAVIVSRLFRLNVHLSMAALLLTTGVYLVVAVPLLLVFL